MGRIRLLCALALSCAVGALRAAEPAPPVDPQVARIVAAMQARLAAADHLWVVLGQVSYAVKQQPVNGGEADGAPYQVFSAMSTACLDRGEEHSTSWSGARRHGPDLGGSVAEQWADQLVFTFDNGERHEQLLMCYGGESSQNGPLVSIREPSRDVRGHLINLGLGLNDGELLTSQLKGTLKVEGGRAIRGYQCEAVVGDNGELWVSKELRCAPLRLILRGTNPNGVASTSVWDWLRYTHSGELELPRIELSRGALQGGRAGDGEPVTTGLSITKIDAAAAGKAAVDALKLPQVHVPLPVGAILQPLGWKMGDDVAEVGPWPHRLVRIGEHDCAEWGVSAKALWADTDFKLPDTD